MSHPGRANLRPDPSRHDHSWRDTDRLWAQFRPIARLPDVPAEHRAEEERMRNELNHGVGFREPRERHWRDQVEIDEPEGQSKGSADTDIGGSGAQAAEDQR